MILFNQSCDLHQLAELAAALARQRFPGMIIYLHGDLAAGKTTFVKQYLSSLGFQGMVKSPTYTLVEPYVINGESFFHFDLYRLVDPYELYDMGIEDYCSDQSQLLVEWPDKGRGVMPAPDIELHCEKTADIHYRQIKVVATSEKAITLCSGFE